MKRYLWLPAVVFLGLDLWATLTVPGAPLWVALVAFVPTLLGVGCAYLYGVRVGLHEGYVKGGDDMIQRVIV